jgi:hypothetical protein
LGRQSSGLELGNRPRVEPASCSKQHAGDAGGRTATEDLYNIFYRGSSMVEVLGGFQAFAAHVVMKDERLDLSVTRRDGALGRGNLLIGAVLIATVASHVLDAFGYLHEPFALLLSFVHQASLSQGTPDVNDLRQFFMCQAPVPV